jgi:hypothetical protein
LFDRIAGIANLEERMDDVGYGCGRSERAALFGISEGAPMCLLFAATYPLRVQRQLWRVLRSFPRRPMIVRFPPEAVRKLSEVLPRRAKFFVIFSLLKCLRAQKSERNGSA